METVLEVMPYSLVTLRCDQAFNVYRVLEDGDLEVIGPPSETDRFFRCVNQGEPWKLLVKHEKGSILTENQVIRDPHEKNNGEVHELKSSKPEPTIQDMIKMYVRQHIHGDDDSETFENSEEFFDFGEEDDDDGHEMYSPYVEMEEQFLPEDQSSEAAPVPEGDADEARTTPESDTAPDSNGATAP